MKKNITNGITICLFLSFAACSNADQDTKTEQVTTDKAAETSATTQPDAPMTNMDMPISGKILETMNTGGYTYLKVDTGSSQPWVAIPESQVKVGDEISCNPGIAMANFTSKTLDRTFDSIIFSSGIVGSTGGGHGGMMGGDDSFSSAVQAEGGSSAAQDSQAASGGSQAATTPFNEVKVEKAIGENSYTIEEIFTKTKELDGKTVRIQGKVVKYSPMIMGRNWIHIQDGTGDPMNNTHDLVITSSEEVNTNDIITVEGVLAFNKDFGAGYKYVAIVEEAKTLK
ncbi:MAG: DNA-binding protein [Proteobacteria bacterium]|nr:DNA-binding protein [Pseudomonadota bacterium]MBU1060437.1 DNA-binding protein [Pseudomonadota bacterium]